MCSASKEIPLEIRHELCQNNCRIYNSCNNHYAERCKELNDLYQEYKEDAESLNIDKLDKMSALELYTLCCGRKIECKRKQSRDKYLQVLCLHGYIDVKTYQKLVFENKESKEADQDNQGIFDVIDEMVTVFGIDSVIQHCKIGAWKHRYYALYHDNKFEDMEIAEKYLNIANELQESMRGVQ